MRAVNLLPDELRSRAAGEGDPRVAYGVVGGLGVLLLMVLLAIFYSNKATTLRDEANALQAQATRYQPKAQAVQPFNDFASVVQKRTLLVGGLAESRFPWDAALRNLARSMPEDVTLDTINTATSGSAEGADNANAATMEMKGCASNWIGMSRFMVRMRNLPGVKDVVGTDANSGASTDTNSTGGGQASGKINRTKNCGLQPVTFGVKVIFELQLVDLVDLPKIDSASAGGATGATGTLPATPAPASSTTPAGG